MIKLKLIPCDNDINRSFDILLKLNNILMNIYYLISTLLNKCWSTKAYKC